MRLHARRWPVWALAAACLAVAVLAVLAWDMLARPRHHGDARVGHGGIQLAVLHDGFALTYPADGGRRVIEIDAQGRARRATVSKRYSFETPASFTENASVLPSFDRSMPSTPHFRSVASGVSCFVARSM